MSRGCVTWAAFCLVEYPTDLVSRPLTPLGTIPVVCTHLLKPEVTISGHDLPLGGREFGTCVGGAWVAWVVWVAAELDVTARVRTRRKEKEHLSINGIMTRWR